MNVLKILFYMLCFTFFVNAKAVNVFKPNSNKDLSKGQYSQSKQAKFYINNDNDVCRILKRKYRHKGIEVINPQISNLTFTLFLVSKENVIISLKESYASFLYCVDCKRGPPTAQ